MRSRAANGSAAASAVLLSAVLALAGCAAPSPADPGITPAASAGEASTKSAPASVGAALAAYDLDGLDTKDLIDRLDAMPVADRPGDLMASIRPHEVLLSTPDGAEESLPLPGDEVYVSVAPYLSHTHDCFFHSLTTCRGELSGVELHVTVTDGDTVVYDEQVRTFDNGFAGLWLPRGIDGEITVESAEGSATAPLSTDDDAPTCVTTLQLS